MYLHLSFRRPFEPGMMSPAAGLAVRKVWRSLYSSSDRILRTLLVKTGVSIITIVEYTPLAYNCQVRLGYIGNLTTAQSIEDGERPSRSHCFVSGHRGGDRSPTTSLRRVLHLEDFRSMQMHVHKQDRR